MYSTFSMQRLMNNTCNGRLMGDALMHSTYNTQQFLITAAETNTNIIANI